MTLAESVHQRLFGHAMSPDMRRFLSHLSWSAVGGIAGSGLLFVTQAIAARLLGPAEFGRASLAMTVGSIAAIGVVLGLDLASSRAISRTNDVRHQNGAITASTMVVLTAAVFWTGVGLLASGVVADALDATRSVVVVGVVYGAFLGCRMLTERHVASLERFRLQAMVRAVEGAAALIGLLVLTMIMDVGFQRLLLALLLSLSTSIAVYVLSIRRRYSMAAVDRSAIADLWVFGRLALLGYLPPLVFFYADKIALQRELGAEQLGLYTAYILTTFGLTAQLSGITSNVLFPSMARIRDKRPVVAKIYRLTLLGFAPLCVIVTGMSWLLLQVFGADFRTTVPTIALFALLAALSFFNGVLVNVVNAHSAESFKREIQFQVARAILFGGTLVALSFSDRLSIHTVALTVIAFELLEHVNLRLIIRVHVTRSPSEGLHDLATPS